jgi:hypothetical protein
MESNGQKNCIHVSQSTADLLIAAGKKHWITPREDMIEAKGKGTWQIHQFSDYVLTSVDCPNDSYTVAL